MAPRMTELNTDTHIYIKIQQEKIQMYQIALFKKSGIVFEECLQSMMFFFFFFTPHFFN